MDLHQGHTLKQRQTLQIYVFKSVHYISMAPAPLLAPTKYHPFLKAEMRDSTSFRLCFFSGAVQGSLLS